MTCWQASPIELDIGRVAGPLVTAARSSLRHHRPHRFAGLPESADPGEVGYKKLDLDFWHMLARARRHAAADRRPLNAALRTALADGKVRKTFADGGMDLFRPSERRPKRLPHCSRARSSSWGDVIRANNISAQ